MSDETQKPPSPKDLAIALKYDVDHDDAPMVIAKGYGEIARKIIATAEENGVVIESNPYLAEALSGVGLDETIPIELYQAVAEVIGFVLKAKNRMS